MARMSAAVPASRLRPANDAPLHPGRYVLYWMIASRRSEANFALQRALWWCDTLDLPLVVLEPLRSDYRFASDRLHRFALDGMADNAARFAAAGVTYHPWVDRSEGEGRGLLEALAHEAAVVVTDHWPAGFHPRMVAAAGRRLDVRLEAVDSCGLLPLSLSERAFPTAHGFRWHLHRTLPEHLTAMPLPDPLADRQMTPVALPEAVSARWPAVPAEVLTGEGAAFLASLPIDHTVRPVVARGGSVSGGERMRRFVAGRITDYADKRNAPGATSGLSPWLHWGHVGAHQVFAALADRFDWTPARLATRPTGAREGWWGLPPGVEAFLDELVTWREVAHAFCEHRPDDAARFAGLPDWARATLEAHADDPRSTLYSLDALSEGRTADPVWNEAQRQLRVTGVIHNTQRMVWGKRVLEWSATPEEAFERLVILNDRYALDGRDPSSYAGIGWVLGRFDRPWGPERPIFGTIRYMSSERTAKKVGLSR